MDDTAAVTTAAEMQKKTRPKSAVGERVEKLRLSRGLLTQKDLARECGVEPQTIWRIETGGSPLSKRTAKKLAKALRTTEAYLMYGDDGSDGAVISPPAVVAEYLASDLGKDAPAEVAARLHSVDFPLLGVPNPGVKDVHRVREMIEFNLALGRKRTT